jgi:hypothetical protein
MMAAMTEACLTVHELRSRWKPTKQRLTAARENHPTAIRLHRAFSWIARCEKSAGGEDDDLVLICLWIGFNALYGRWDPRGREPLPDRLCWRQFLDRLLALDSTGHIAAMLQAQRTLVMEILDDEYLSGFFWQEPSDVRASRSKKAKFDARTWYLTGNWGMILDRLIERIYLLRCQLVHGAATFGGRLNRTSLARCIIMLRHLMNAVLLAMIDHGDREDWGPMCYPPLQPVHKP